MAGAVPLAERAALAAILADSEDPWAHYALGCAHLYNRRFDDSLAEFELALRLNPNFSLAQAYHGLALAYSGRWEEGIVAVRRALRLSPRDPYASIYCGIAACAHYVGREYAEAMRLSREGIRQRSDFIGAHRVLTAAAGMAGQPEVRGAALQELRRAQPNISLDWIGSKIPIKQPTEMQHYLEGFRRSGLS
jgi:tetratricopeptide (TPR) repeat protein